MVCQIARTGRTQNRRKQAGISRINPRGARQPLHQIIPQGYRTTDDAVAGS